MLQTSKGETMKKFYISDVQKAFVKIIEYNWDDFDKDRFIILSIERLARKIHPQLYRYRAELVKVSQNWWKRCPKQMVPNKKLIEKMIYSDDKWIYFAYPSHAMHDFYGYFDEEKKDGCFLHIDRYWKNRAI